MMVEVFYLLLYLLYLSPVIIIIISFLEITNVKCFYPLSNKMCLFVSFLFLLYF